MQVERDPLVRHRSVDAALKITVANIEKIDASQDAIRRRLVAHENVKDLAAHFFVGQDTGHSDPFINVACALFDNESS
ncbi:MAG TPA: hypothetical protein VMH84_14380 [Xanthobacteraceae bacterium]|nr:hypothetical protein [Xanthobacteraceae bacterium]